jgi:integrase
VARVVTEASVKRGVVSPLKAALRHAAAEWGERRGCREPVFPRLSEGLPRQLWLRPAQARALETALAALRDPVALAAFVVGVCEGPRSSELCRLRRGDVDLPGGRVTLTITKRTGAPLRHEIHDLRPRTVSALGALLAARPAPHADDELVFADAPGAAGRGDEAAFNRWFNDRLSAAAGAVATAGVALGFVPTAHVLRHTAATWHYAVCRDVKAVKDRAGWSTLRMADQYAKSAPHGMADEVRAHWEGTVA